MVEEPRSEFKPIWFVVGGAALAVIGVCALVSLCAAAAVLWFSVPRSSTNVLATRTAVQRQAAATTTIQNTSPAITVTIGAVIVPTLLPVPSTPGGVPTAFSFPSQTTAPDQAVRSYYNLVSLERYDQTWPLLTDDFKQKFNCCNPNYNYTGYVDWWNSVDRVDFGSVRTVSQNGNRAVVYAELYYIMNDGARSSMDSTPYIALVYDAAMGSWRFDDKRATP